MGTFLANFHVRSDDPNAVSAALTDIGAGRFRLAPPKRGWVSVYEQRASTQDEAWITRLATELSGRLDTACVAFLLHDSDIACYWLNDRGQLLDEYNSAPDYFEEASAADKERVRGQPDVFQRYCRPSVTRQQVEAVLRADVVFADDTISQLAAFLGIDAENALHDFRDAGGGGGDVDDDEDGGDGGGIRPGGADMASMMQAMQQRMASMFAPPGQTSSPQSDALVDAAASGNIEEIDKLVAAGADVNAAGLLPLQPFAGASMLGAAMTPKVAIAPLLAAASRGQTAAVQRLLALGANLHESSPLCGTALHAAAQGGSADTVRALLAAGLPAGVKNTQGQTPRAVVQAVRAQIELTKNLAQSMPQLRQVYDQLLKKFEGMNLPTAGWDACDELLRQAGG